MNEFKSICMKGHTQSKQYLHNLYTDKFGGSGQPIEDEKIFWYRGISFQFAGTGFRVPEQMVLYVWVPGELLPDGQLISAGNEPSGCLKSTKVGFDIWRMPQGSTIPLPAAGVVAAQERTDWTAFEDWLLRLLAEPVNALSEGLQNDKKDFRDKPHFSMQTPGVAVQRRNGCLYVEEKMAFRLRIHFGFPLINGNTVNGKSGYKGIKRLLDAICDCLERSDAASLQKHIFTYACQLEIRRYIKEKNLVAFVANGSILPRQGDTDAPLQGAVPFQSPSELQVEVPMPDGSTLAGMGIKKGITIITGGGYSGKSTLLDALEQGIYFHVRGDGREYVISDETACKIYAEDGRYIQDMDISPFFFYMPGKDPHHFQTLHASGSVSQAANIIEAVYGGSRCLLIDEDTSATNFMIRDEGMRELVKKEPIIPYTDRIEELKEMGVSTILVIGGSSEYLKYGDCVLLLEDYHIYDRTDQVRQNHRGGGRTEKTAVLKKSHGWMERKVLPDLAALAGKKGFFYSECVRIENARYIKIDNYVADITRMTAVTEECQINSLTWLLEKLLMEEGRSGIDLRERCQEAVKELFASTFDTLLASRAHRYGLWLEQIRSLDLVMAVSRLRNL